MFSQFQRFDSLFIIELATTVSTRTWSVEKATLSQSLSLRRRLIKGWGGGGGREFGQKNTKKHWVFGQILSLLPLPIPLYACYAGYRSVFSLFQPSISRQERSETSSPYYFENYHILWRKLLDSTISIQQEPLTRGLQLPHIFRSRRFHRPIYF